MSAALPPSRPRFHLLWLLGALLLVALAGEARGDSDPLVFGHRGARQNAPDNSGLAFEQAKVEGADGVELDVRVSRDGEVVVFHDSKVTLPTGEERAVSKMSVAELKAIDLGKGQRILTLREAMDVLGPKMWVNIELKPAWRRRGVERKVAAIVRELGAGRRVMVSSFDPRMVRRFKKHAPHIQAGILVRKMVPWRLDAKVAKADAVHPEREMATEKVVRRMQERGYKVIPWTVDKSAEVKNLAKWKVDGIITDRPARARRTLEGAKARREQARGSSRRGTQNRTGASVGRKVRRQGR